MRHASFVLLACLAAASPLAAQRTGRLEGTVRDAGTNVLLEGAQVLLQGTGLSALTDSAGKYAFPRVRPGRYTLLARRIGYQSSEIRNVTIERGKTRTIDVGLTQATA